MKRIVTISVALISVILQTLCAYYVWIEYYNKMILKAFWFKGHFFVMIIYIIVLLFFTKTFGGLKIGYLKQGEILFASILANISANFVFYLELCLLKYGFPNPMYLLIAMVVQIVMIIIVVLISGKSYYAMFPPYQVLLIYDGDSLNEFMNKLITRKDKFEISKTIHISVGLEQLEREIKQYTAVMLWDIPNDQRNDLFKICYTVGVRIYVMPKISDIILMGSETMHFFDTPLLLTRSNPLTFEERLIKRVMDLILLTIIAIPAVPIMLVASLIIKLQDGGKVFYTQTRCTRGGKEFKIYKFRSMVENAEKDGVARLATSKDQRITPFGKFIRATRIDELPQLINVLRGEMSFVGPRPERPEIMKDYEKQLPEFQYRLKVKAGLTGYAQVYGKYNTTPYDKLKLDLFYIEQYSLKLDLALLIQTIKIVFTPESTQGVGEGKTTANK